MAGQYGDKIGGRHTGTCEKACQMVLTEPLLFLKLQTLRLEEVKKIWQQASAALFINNNRRE